MDHLYSRGQQTSRRVPSETTDRRAWESSIISNTYVWMEKHALHTETTTIGSHFVRFAGPDIQQTPEARDRGAGTCESGVSPSGIAEWAYSSDMGVARVLSEFQEISNLCSVRRL